MLFCRKKCATFFSFSFIGEGSSKYRKERKIIKELTSKEELFCTYYSLGRNGKEAAIKSGYRFPEKAAARLLQKSHIKKFIANIDKQRKNSSVDIACGFYRLAFGCVSDAVRLMFSEDMSDEQLQELDLFNVCEIKRKKGGDIEIKFFDRLKALQMLSEMLGENDEDKAKGLYSAIEKGALALKEDEDE